MGTIYYSNWDKKSKNNPANGLVLRSSSNGSHFYNDCWGGNIITSKYIAAESTLEYTTS